MQYALKIIDKFYPQDTPLKQILLTHSMDVMRQCLTVCDRHPELSIDRQLLTRGALLHDIGIFLTDAPGIQCFGTKPYLLHGYLGAELLRSLGEDELARFCERHTGTGLRKETIIERQMDIPIKDYLPETLCEKIVCYSDKFFSKSNLTRHKTPEQVCLSLAKFGEESVQQFKLWYEQFG